MPTAIQPKQISPQRLSATLQKLTVDIGVRLAGTTGEKKAGDYIADQLHRSGASVTREVFPVKARDVTTERLEIFCKGKWRRFPASLFSSTPGTDGKRVEAPLVFFEAATEYQRPSLAHLRGKAVVHLGCHIESRQSYQRLIEAGPAFLLFVDVRYPGTVPLADGMFPAYTRALGAVPTMNVAYQDAWQWKVDGGTAARLQVAGGMRDSESENIVGDLPGRDPRAGIIYVGCHHDTQANSVGADDNGTGVAGLLELARVLAPLPRRRTIRLISFGTEEQLSVGSASYVRRHRDEVAKQGRLMFNLDSLGSWMGITELICNGPSQLEKVVSPYFERRGQYTKVRNDVVPYADHFPFVAAGIPGVWLYRSNCTGGRFFHHRPDDDLSRVSMRLMAELLESTAACLTDLSNAKRLPFPVSVPKLHAKQVRHYWTDLFGGWKPA